MALSPIGRGPVPRLASLLIFVAGLFLMLLLVSAGQQANAGSRIIIEANNGPSGLTTTPTPTCAPDYLYWTDNAEVTPGSTDIGVHCDNCEVIVTLPFQYYFYTQFYSAIRVNSNGYLQFGSGGQANIACLPDPSLNNILAAYLSDLTTDPTAPGCPGYNCGVYTSVSNSAPNRIFNIEWRAIHQGTSARVIFEVRLHEAMPPSFELVYNQVVPGNNIIAAGAQYDMTRYTSYTCDSGYLGQYTRVTFWLPPCGTPSVTPTSTATVTPTSTNTATPTATYCAVPFTDVHPTDYFFNGVRYLYCKGAISGYTGNLFLPYNNITRGQATKWLVLGYNFSFYTPPTPTFNDVHPTNPFYQYIETAYYHNLISGYSCGGQGEPCPGLYFRPNNPITRAQICKVVDLAGGWWVFCPPDGGPTFNDVPYTNPFACYIETAYRVGIISGYNCGSPGEPCPGLYFRPNASTTRGQYCKVLYAAISHGP